MRGAVLQQAVGESPGGCSHVKAGSARNVDLPVFKSCGQLQPATAYVGKILAEQTDGRIGRNGSSGLVDLLLADKDAPGNDQRPRPLAAGGKAAIDEEYVEPRSFRPCFFRACFFSGPIFVRRSQVGTLSALNV